MGRYTWSLNTVKALDTGSCLHCYQSLVNYFSYVNCSQQLCFFNKFSILLVHSFYINRDFVFWKWFSFQVISLLYANNLSLVICHELPTKTIVLLISAYFYSLDLTGYLNNMLFFFLLSAWLKYSWGREGLETLHVVSMCAGAHAPLNIPRSSVSCKNSCEK